MQARDRAGVRYKFLEGPSLLDLENFGRASGGASIGFWKHWGGHGPPGPPGLTGPVNPPERIDQVLPLTLK